VIPPQRGEEFAVNITLPGGELTVCHSLRREIVLGRGRPPTEAVSILNLAEFATSDEPHQFVPFGVR
jgi:hypothetical protein